jgi:hypothetical protein
VFQIAEVDPSTGRRFDVAAFYTNSMHKKARLRIDLSSWAGRPLTEDECRAFDPKGRLGRTADPCVHAAEEDGTTYANDRRCLLKGATTAPVTFVQKDQCQDADEGGVAAPVTKPIEQDRNPMPASNASETDDERNSGLDGVEEDTPRDCDDECRQ